MKSGLKTAVIILLLAAIPGFSKTVVVDSTTSGLSNSVNSLAPGDTILFHKGIYKQGINITVKGTPEKKITIKNYPGEVPILQGPAGNGGSGISGSNVRGVRIEGFILRYWHYGGISLGWGSSTRAVEVRYCLADSNGANGMQMANTDSTVFEYCIASRNGSDTATSWSSGIDYFGGNAGTNNHVRCNVSFNNIDVSTAKSDGMGFILDTGDSLAGVNFENNISFANGGSGLAVTNSTNIKLIGNTCFNNYLDPAEKYTYGAVSFANSTAQRNNFVVRNNLLVQTTGRGSIYCFASPNNFTNSIFENNFTSTNAAANSLFMDADNADFRLRDTAASVVGKGTGTGIFPTDIGFDPQCVKKVSGQTITWWQYAPDIAYIISKGGLEHCFNPFARGTPVDIGAYCKNKSSISRKPTALSRKSSYNFRFVAPAAGSSFLTFYAPGGQSVVLEIYAINGKLLGTYRVRAKEGAVESVPLRKFSRGWSGLCYAVLKQNDAVVAKNCFVNLHVN
jgi:hypothetical protein